MKRIHWYTMKYQKVLITGYRDDLMQTCFTGTEEQCSKFVALLDELKIEDIKQLIHCQDRRITMNSKIIRN